MIAASLDLGNDDCSKSRDMMDPTKSNPYQQNPYGQNPYGQNPQDENNEQIEMTDEQKKIFEEQAQYFEEACAQQVLIYSLTVAPLVVSLYSTFMRTMATCGCVQVRFRFILS